MTPLFSVIIPAYNQAKFLPTTIQSVLSQTLQDFEIVIVNDASPDNTTEIVQQIPDSRIRLIIHEKNKRLPATRNTGMRAAHGKYLALLDADDLFHPHKLATHYEFLEQHPEISVTYNSRFELNYSETSVRELVRPPLTVCLKDLIHGYPFTPSDMVFRKNIIDTVGVFDESFTAGGEDMEYPSKLSLAGCTFASVDRALNYRRHHSGHYRKNLDARLHDVQNALAKIYADPRCPQEIRDLGHTPLSEHYTVLIYLAFIQNRTEDGQRFLHELLQINPKVQQGHPSQLTEYFSNNSAADEKDSPIEILTQIFSQLPDLPVDITGQLDWAIQQAYLTKGVRAALWGRPHAAKIHFQKAAEVKAVFTNRYLAKVVQHIINFEFEMGSEAMQAALNHFLPNIQLLCEPSNYRRFLGELSARRAFENFQHRRYRQVPGNIFQAYRNDPRFIANRGMFSIFVRSLLQR